MTPTTFPAVEVTLAGHAPFVSYCDTVTVRGNPVIRDQYGYSLRVSPTCVRPLGYDITVAIVDGKLVTTAVAS
jgi:hypothetical protein